MPTVSSRIWTRVAVSISYDDNHYTTGTVVWLYHQDLSARIKKLDGTKDVACCFEQILETATPKTAVVRTLVFNHTKHPHKTNKACWKARMNSWTKFSCGLSHMDASVLANKHIYIFISFVWRLDTVWRTSVLSVHDEFWLVFSFILFFFLFFFYLNSLSSNFSNHK